jgi:hypothetical protein
MDGGEILWRILSRFSEWNEKPRGNQRGDIVFFESQESGCFRSVQPRP